MIELNISASKNGLSRWLLGFSIDRTLIYHRWLGRWTILLGTIHWITSWIYYSQQNQNNFGVALQQIVIKYSSFEFNIFSLQITKTILVIHL